MKKIVLICLMLCGILIPCFSDEIEIKQSLPETFNRDKHMQEIEKARIEQENLNGVNWGPYMRELESRIKRNWNPPKGDESKRVIMLFTIGRDGRLLSIKTVKSSGSAKCDLAAKKAIESATPFKPFPDGFKGNSIDIEFTLDYNVIGGRKNKKTHPALDKFIQELEKQNQ